MSCLAYMGQAVFAGATRNKTLPDFISCFARHVGECERTGRNGSTANYRMAYRMLVRYVGGGKLPPDQFTAECRRCLTMIHYLKDGEIPTLDNIL